MLASVRAGPANIKRARRLQRWPSRARRGARPQAPMSVGKNANPVAELQSRVKGFALDLGTGGPDRDDMEFRESA